MLRVSQITQWMYSVPKVKSGHTDVMVPASRAQGVTASTGSRDAASGRRSNALPAIHSQRSLKAVAL